MRYLIGDLQGCCSAFERLLATIDFSPSRDHLVVLGDLVNRGPDSLGTLRRLRELGEAATCLLGNHDLNLLAVAFGLRKQGKGDTLDAIIDSPEREAWIDWLRRRRMALLHEGWLLVHAGVPPQWDTDTTLALAGEIEDHLRSDDLRDFLTSMYGNAPSRWDESLAGPDRRRFVVNALTRIRFVQPDGTLELKASGPADSAPEGLLPWFDAPGRRTQGQRMAFGHWAALGLVDRPDLLALDTGCVWGGQLTAARIDGERRELIQVPCDAPLHGLARGGE